MSTKTVPDNWWRAACEKIPYPLACVDIDNRFIWMNSAYCKVIGYGPTELIGKQWQTITQLKDIGADEAALDKLLKGELNEYTIEKECIKRDGTHVAMTVYVHRFPEFGGNVLCFIVSAEAKIDMICKMWEEIVVLRAEFERSKNRTSLKIIDFCSDHAVPIISSIAAIATVIAALIAIFK